MKNDIAIKVDHVSKTFRLPHNKQNTFKGALVNLIGKGDRTYETQHVLRDVSFEIKKGEFFGIVGRNGSGKSTLLKMLAGIYTPTKGTVTVNGSLTPFIELGVGFNPELTGQENVYMNGALLGFSNKEMDAMYGDVVSFAELERFMDQKLKNYSSGMQVRLAFSIAIRARSDILVLDEVLAVGDAAFQQKCNDYFEQLREDKQTVVLVTHDMSAVTRFCSRAMLIEGGDIRIIGDPGQVADMYAEENLAGPTAQDRAEPYVLDIDIVEQTDDMQCLKFTHDFPSPEEVYVGFTLFKNGANIAELNSIEQNIQAATIRYDLTTTSLNPGTYEISAGLFAKKTRAPLAICQQRKWFVMKGHDDTRAGAIKLDHTWYEGN